MWSGLCTSAAAQCSDGFRRTSKPPQYNALPSCVKSRYGTRRSSATRGWVESEWKVESNVEVGGGGLRVLGVAGKLTG